jgi:2-polyprenyl-3-methyl-5-hydroxy-6-metoxy-1,4-benzoquinol methylase
MNKSDFNPSYIGARPDIQKLISPDSRIILDVGCSTGTLGAAIKAKTGAQIIGIELSPEMAEDARTRIDKVFTGDAADIFFQGKLDEYMFDTIIFADVLEHMVDPWSVLKEAAKHLDPKGTIIASIPNIRHIDTIFNLVIRGRWPYRERGIHDRTHLRFFTKRNMKELFESAGLTMKIARTKYRFVDRSHYMNRFARPLALPGIRNFLAFQYLIKSNHK